MSRSLNRYSAREVKKKLPHEPVKIAYLFLLISYGFVTVLTPNLFALDSNGPKFLSLALLNLATYLFLFTRKKAKHHPEGYYVFFRNGIGIAYIGLMVVSLLSFFKAINALESVLHFAKIFTTFSAAYLISILVTADKRNIRYLSVAMTMLLIFDDITVFSWINNYIQGKVGSVFEVQTIYSNKNILASSIFVKIPFALWLMVFNRSWLRVTGILGTFLALIATLFLSTRAFYLGIFALTILLVLFFSIRYKQTNDKYHLKLTGIYLILVLLSFLIYSITQNYLYPKADAKGLSVGVRLATITDPGGGGRLEGWKRSWHVFKEDPILGVGLGNWKIATLKEENLTTQESTHYYKAHNDFIEIATETGIFGGLLFLTMFLLTGWIFLRKLLGNASPEWLILFFLPAFGLLCYSVDAFFNFPQDRPEIQALFALYIGMAVAFSSLYFEELARQPYENSGRQASFFHPYLTYIQIPRFFNQIGKSNTQIFRLPLMNLFGILLSVSIYILYLNVNSLKLQRVVYEDIIQEKLTHSSAQFLNGFPFIPDLNSQGIPIAVDKARYLMNEQRYNEAISLLKKDKSNPFDVGPDFFIAFAYSNQNNIDSALTYYQKAYKIKPNYFKNISNLCLLLQKKGLQKEGEAIIDKYLSKTKNNKEAWLYASTFYEKSGNILKAASVIDTAAIYFPTDIQLLKQKKTIDNKALIVPYQTLYDTALVAFKAKKYNEATGYFSELLIKVPHHVEAHIYRAFCYYNIKEYSKSNLDLDFLISIGETKTSYYNIFSLRGVNYGFLGNDEEACKNFKLAADMGDKDGLDNYSKHCQTGKK